MNDRQEGWSELCLRRLLKRSTEEMAPDWRQKDMGTPAICKKADVLIAD